VGVDPAVDIGGYLPGAQVKLLFQRAEKPFVHPYPVPLYRCQDRAEGGIYLHHYFRKVPRNNARLQFPTGSPESGGFFR
jgi:hypothetical protein